VFNLIAKNIGGKFSSRLIKVFNAFIVLSRFNLTLDQALLQFAEGVARQNAH